MLITAIVSIVVAFVAAAIGYVLRKHVAEKKIQDAESQAEHILEQARKEALDKRIANYLKQKIRRRLIIPCFSTRA